MRLDTERPPSRFNGRESRRYNRGYYATPHNTWGDGTQTWDGDTALTITSMVTDDNETIATDDGDILIWS